MVARPNRIFFIRTSALTLFHRYCTLFGRHYTNLKQAIDFQRFCLQSKSETRRASHLARYSLFRFLETLCEQIQFHGLSV